jgi:hypothetical protein
MVVSDTEEVHPYVNIHVHSTGTLIPLREDKRLSSCHGVVGLDPLLAQPVIVQLGRELPHLHLFMCGRVSSI